MLTPNCFCFKVNHYSTQAQLYSCIEPSLAFATRTTSNIKGSRDLYYLEQKEVTSLECVTWPVLYRTQRGHVIRVCHYRKQKIPYIILLESVIIQTSQLSWYQLVYSCANSTGWCCGQAGWGWSTPDNLDFT